MIQPELNFTTSSPINIDRMKGQCKDLYNYLITGNRITCFSEAMRTLKIGYLNSRISDLRNKNKVNIRDRFITVTDIDGNQVTAKEYWIEK